MTEDECRSAAVCVGTKNHGSPLQSTTRKARNERAECRPIDLSVQTVIGRCLSRGQRGSFLRQS
jgi:hypothetical protein